MCSKFCIDSICGMCDQFFSVKYSRKLNGKGFGSIIKYFGELNQW